jgi:hypothetical protein
MHGPAEACCAMPHRGTPCLASSRAHLARLCVRRTPRIKLREAAPYRRVADRQLQSLGRLLLRAGRLTPEAVDRAKAGRALDGSSMGTNRSAGYR